jgi:hypothetical protein
MKKTTREKGGEAVGWKRFRAEPITFGFKRDKHMKTFHLKQRPFP